MARTGTRTKKIATRITIITAILGALAGLVPSYIMLDKWLIERRQLINRAYNEELENDCTEHGGKWWAGDCLFEELATP